MPFLGSTLLLTKNEIDQVFSDNANHLYAISNKAGKPYVFTETPLPEARLPVPPTPSLAHKIRSCFRNDFCEGETRYSGYVLAGLAGGVRLHRLAI